MRLLNKVVLGFALLFPMSVSAKIIKTAEMSHVNDAVKNIIRDVPAENIWVVYDVDSTLTMPENLAADASNLHEHRDALRRIFSDLTAEQVNQVKLYTFSVGPQRTVENNTARYVRELQKTGLTAFALASVPSGPVLPGNKVSLYSIRPSRLSAAGIHFEGAFPFETTFLKQFPSHNGAFPTYHRGVICTNGESKGKDLCTFIEHIKSENRPQVVVLVDNTRDNLKDVKKTIRSNFPNVRFVGIEYTRGTIVTEGAKIITINEFRSYWEDVARKIRNFPQTPEAHSPAPTHAKKPIL